MNAQTLEIRAIEVTDNAIGDAPMLPQLAERDPGQVVLGKAAIGAVAKLVLARIFSEPWPSLTAVSILLLIGAKAYGLSLHFYLLAQRAFSAGRTGSVFAFAPFIGAGLAVVLGDRSGSWVMVVGSVLMLLGVALHLMESHGHDHQHELLTHEHAHTHGDGHHDHMHNDFT